MRKIPTVFKRDPKNLQLVLDEANPECFWVLKGEGVPTRKFDGSPVLVRSGSLYKRYDCKKGRVPPEGFEPVGDPDPITGHWPGWLPLTDDANDQWFMVAIENKIEELAKEGLVLEEGTYEAVGPHFQGNPERFRVDTLVRHGAELCVDVPRSFDSLKAFLGSGHIEGIVWHHEDGIKFAKIKGRDFGIRRTRP